MKNTTYEQRRITFKKEHPVKHYWHEMLLTSPRLNSLVIKLTAMWYVLTNQSVVFNNNLPHGLHIDNKNTKTLVVNNTFGFSPK